MLKTCYIRKIIIMATQLFLFLSSIQMPRDNTHKTFTASPSPIEREVEVDISSNYAFSWPTEIPHNMEDNFPPAYETDKNGNRARRLGPPMAQPEKSSIPILGCQPVWLAGLSS